MNEQYEQLWRQIEQAGGVDAYVYQQLVAQGYFVERKDTSRLSEKELKIYKNALKEEAVKKKQLKQNAWKIYKANHIVHIGEYYYWNDHDVKDEWDLDEPDVRAAENSLPQLDSPKQVAQWLEISVVKLRWLCYHRDVSDRIHYKRFTIPKRNGDPRAIWAPLPLLKKCQRTILREITEKLPVHGSAHGFLCGRSTYTNAINHTNAQIMVKMDIKDFFPSITFPRIKGVFRKAGYREQVAILLAALCSESPREIVEFEGKSVLVALGPRCLPQGAPTSPSLTNTLCLSLDRRLEAYAQKHQWRYSRYADDLTFSIASMDDKKQINKLLGTVVKITSEEGFRINSEKTRIFRQGNRQQVTGMVVNGEGKPRVCRKVKRQIRAAIYNLQKGKTLKDGETIDTIKGYIAYIHMSDPTLAGKLRQQLESIQK